MLVAKVEQTAIISLWHYFCALGSSYSDYLITCNNISVFAELLMIL